jgi:putative N-acetylmannosamine-6-phosphate epimerase/predicted NBD/HSP70 family sugar kinase
VYKGFAPLSNQSSNLLSTLLQTLRGGLIVSCQAGEDDAIYGADGMAAMARAAAAGGAVGIRANGADEIAAIRAAVDLPIIGIEKQDWRGLGIRITPTFEAARRVGAAGASIIAFDATRRASEEDRPMAGEFTRFVHDELGLLVMADCSTYEEGIAAAHAGADMIATTLSGYTPYSPIQDAPDFLLAARLAMALNTPVIAEGRIATPGDARRLVESGVFAVVVGSMITRPRWITQQFVEAMRTVRTVRSGTDSRLRPILGVDIGGTKISAGVVDATGESSSVQTIATDAGQGGAAVLARVIGLIETLLNTHAGISGIGVATAGEVDAAGTIFHASDLMPGWMGTPLAERLQTRFNLPVRVENDGQAVALAEALYGVGVGYPSTLAITVGTGIGGGFAIDGKVYSGANGAALSLGQIIVERDGIACVGGERGRLECYASGSALLRTYNERVPESRRAADGHALEERVHTGEPEALQAVETAAGWLGIGVANVLNILNPGVVAIGGGVARLGEPFFAPLRAAIARYAYPTVRATPILPAKLGTDAGIIGGAALLRSHEYSGNDD